ncbi:hypothetical protein TNCV_210371 [Trichonephila clavipes]|uniref:Uncharacterized protein n=1 Tax=Trichonephila clavipes TaxID=2585209 RepID=A0A8X6VSU5_TRICX|nr:hypothetical protein TNCV_210371 [Trichonephila clavipes]
MNNREIINPAAKSQQIPPSPRTEICHYPVKYHLIGPQFVFAVKPSLQAHWSDEIEEAWMQLFRYMAHVMKTAMRETTANPPVNNKS